MFPIPGELFWVITLVSVGVPLFALVDAAIRPAPAFVAAGKQTKALWLVILAVAALVGIGFGLLGLVALIATIVYFVDVRPAVREVQGGGRYGGSAGGRW